MDPLKAIQGEGPYIGIGSFFIRFGGCDYRCIWCDSMHAVLPDAVKKLPSMTEDEILDELFKKTGIPNFRTFRPVIVLSGGNPTMWDLTNLVRKIKKDWNDPIIQVETQGTIWRDWLVEADHVVVSPKPPSSGMETDWDQLEEFLGNLEDEMVQTSIKVVVFDERDLEYALYVGDRFVEPGHELYLSVGTRSFDTPQDVLNRSTWLAENVWTGLKEGLKPRDYFIRVHPQMHVLFWGHKLGV